MNQPQIRTTWPYSRFRERTNLGLRGGPGSLYFKQKSKFFHCEECGRKTKIQRSWLNTWKPLESVFPEEVKSIFPPLGTHSVGFDFFCKGCGLPVRLVFWEQEQGMGGFWYPLIKEIQELINKP